MTQQSSNPRTIRSADAAIDRTRDACDELAARLCAAGRRGAPPTSIGEALVAYWKLVARTDAASRAHVLQALREGIAAGHTTARAWVPVALGEPDFRLAREAALAYVGGWPASVDRRSQVVDEVVDWIVRGLALDRVALCCALLERADATCLQSLGRVRSRLEAREADAVIEALRNRVLDDEVAAFVDEWRSVSCGVSRCERRLQSPA